jgi:hypothetical protein
MKINDHNLSRKIALNTFNEQAKAPKERCIHQWFIRSIKTLLLLVTLGLSACQTLSQSPPAPLPPITETQSPTVTLTQTTEIPTALPTPEPSETPTFTPVATYAPSQLRAAASAGLDRIIIATEGRHLICLRYEDLDTDGSPEWLALTHQQDTPPNLQAFILDETSSYILEPAQPKPGIPDVGLGQFPVCQIVLRDINLDGQTEIAIFGHTQDNETLLHLFHWDIQEAQYARLGYFSGDAGVLLVETDGDLALEIWEGYRIQEAPSLTWYVIHTWQDQTYGWTSDRFDWYFQDRPQAYPSHAPDFAVIAFYLALNDRDIPGAYELLLSQSRANYETWALGYATTLRIDIGGAHIIPNSASANRARVAAMVTAYDNENGTIIKRLWNVEWDTVLTEQGWRLVTSSTEMLEEDKVTYFP